MPFPPTAATQRRAAVQAYLDGELLCDKGDVAAGVSLFKHATFLAWELDATEWPAWAEDIYREMVDGTPPPPPPPLLAGPDGSEASIDFMPVALQKPWTATAMDRGQQQQWWDAPTVLDAVCHSLATQHFAVIDCFAGSSVAETFRDACEAQWNAGQRFKPAKVAAPGGSTDGARSARTRSDHIAWVDVTGGIGEGDTESLAFHSGLRSIVAHVDALIRGLTPRLLPTGPGRGDSAEEATTVISRQRPMISRYGEGDAFARHCDNYCPVEGNGPHCNHRWLTAVFYASDRHWSRKEDGGCLRVYRPQGDAAADDEDLAMPCHEDGALVDVAPLADRLLLFYSDFRVPHAVLPVTSCRARYAVTCWVNRRIEAEAQEESRNY